MYNSQVLVFMLQQNWQPYGSALGWKPIQFISLRLKRQCSQCPMKRGLQIFRLTKQCWNRKIEIRHTHTHTHAHTNPHTVSLPAGQQTSSFPPLCTQFPPAGWPTWPAHRAGSLGWHHTVERFVNDVYMHTNKQWINTDSHGFWNTQNTTRLLSTGFQMPKFKENCTDLSLQSLNTVRLIEDSLNKGFKTLY